MTTVKRTNSNLTIITTNIPGNITLDTSEVIIVGDLRVLGTQTTLETTNTVINDNIIVLNGGEIGPGVTNADRAAGIVIDRGWVDGNIQANIREYIPSLGWDDSIEKWVLTNDGVNFETIASFAGGNVGITAVEDDPNPKLGGNLNTLSYEIFSSTNNVIVNDALQLKTQATPANVTASSILYANTIGGGTTGIYVVNDQVVAGEELVTKTRAFGFSLIL
jgi:hypothetical protein